MLYRTNNVAAALFLIAAVFILMQSVNVFAADCDDLNDDECTLIGAANYSVRGGGTLVLKNRDRNTRFIQSLDFVRPAGGYFFIGIKNLFFKKGDELSYTMGINEKGLSCVSSSPPVNINYDFGEKKYKVYHPGRILAEIASVEEFVEKVLKTGRLECAMNYIVADSKKMCVVELVSGNAYDYKIIINGVAAQTNHYYFDRMKKYQGFAVNKSSRKRLERALELISGKPVFTPEDFMAISADHGSMRQFDDENICRHPDMVYGAKKFDGGTLSSMVLVSKEGRNPAAYISLGQPCVSRWLKFEISSGGCKISPLYGCMYSSGIADSLALLKRDVYFHFIFPFAARMNSGEKSSEQSLPEGILNNLCIENVK